MANKRHKRRFRARLQVRCGASDPLRPGMTENISPEGLCIRTNAIHPKNSYIRVDLTTPSHERVVMIGRVCWAKRVPPNLARLGEMGSMGIQIVRFLAGSGVYLMLCEAVASRNTAEPDTY